MSSIGLFSRRRQEFPTLPRGEVLGTYDSYVEAQAVVDRLSKAEFPVKQLAIVGNDLKTVERVTGISPASVHRKSCDRLQLVDSARPGLCGGFLYRRPVRPAPCPRD